MTRPDHKIDLSSCAEPASMAPEKSPEICVEECLVKSFPHAAHQALLRRGSATDGRRVDPHRFRVVFPDRWSTFLRAHYRSPEHVAFEYGVAGRTAEHWWHGRNHRPSGDKVAHAALRHPASFAAIIGDAA